uniref:G_PROTEIN_RECEP_F1_2 domain-containing protein n=1 Tax=Steinernema glaseri TaxID=37863 RepID=A0A1I7Z884_9BILA
MLIFYRSRQNLLTISTRTDVKKKLRNLIYVLTIDKDYKRHYTYRIMRILCFANLLQSIPFLVGGVMTIAQSNFSDALDRQALGSMIASGWYLYICTSVTLAVDRLLIFVFPRATYSSMIRTAFVALSIFVWLITLVGMSFLPGLGYTYECDGEYYFWSYTLGSVSEVVVTLEPYCDMCVFSITFCIYLIVCRYLIKLKRSSTDQSTSLKAEFRILIVAVCAFFYEIVFVIWSFWIPLYLLGLRFMYIYLNVTWMVECGMFASLTLIINAILRRKVFRIWGAKKKTKVVSINGQSVFQSAVNKQKATTAFTLKEE